MRTYLFKEFFRILKLLDNALESILFAKARIYDLLVLVSHSFKSVAV